MRVPFLEPWWPAAWRILAFLIVWAVLLAPLVIPVASGDRTPATPGMQLYFDAAGLLTLMAAAWIATRFFDRRAFRSLGFEPSALPRDSAAGLLIALGMIAGALAMIAAAGWLQMEWTPPSIRPSFGLVAVSLLANSITQELLFRGYILQTIESRSSISVAVGLSACLFTAAHGGALTAGIVPATNLLLAGILLGLAYTATRNLWLPIALHFGWNFLQGPALGLAVSGQDVHGGVTVLQTTLGGPPVLSGGTFGLEGGVVGTIVTLAGIAAVMSLASAGGGVFTTWRLPSRSMREP